MDRLKILENYICDIANLEDFDPTDEVDFFEKKGEVFVDDTKGSSSHHQQQEEGKVFVVDDSEGMLDGQHNAFVVDENKACVPIEEEKV